MTVDWESYRQCPVCFAELGKPCIKFYAVVAGLAEMVEEADEPHTSRKLTAAGERDAKFGRVINPAGDGR